MKQIEDFCYPLFQTAFKTYFTEFDIVVNDWNSLFQGMNTEQGNLLYLIEDKGECIAFIQFRKDVFTNWFFKEEFGFIREFWVKAEHRGQGLGTSLMQEVEAFFKGEGISRVILTSDSAKGFYLSHGYQIESGIKAKNENDVFVKNLP